jgi:hypothetical protein
MSEMRARRRLWGMFGLLGLIASAGLLRLGRSKAAAPGEAYVGDDDDCRVGETLVFDSGSTIVNLAAQAKLNEALQWVQEAPGRRLMLLGADGPRPEDAHLGAVRASAAVMFLINNGANPIVVSRSDFRDLTPSRHYARADIDSVVVLTCDVADPTP